MSVKGAGASRGGGNEFHNEDAFLALEGLGLYAVSDGASEQPGGEVAAALATRALSSFMTAADEGPAVANRLDDVVVREGLAHALRAVREAAEQNPEYSGMTASVTLLLTDGHRGVIGHRGDSRAYLIRRRRAMQLTLDQEITENVAPDDSDPEVQVFALDLRPGDTLVLCTDGAEAVVEDEALVRVAGDLSPRVLASRLVSDANRRFPEQDATVVAVRVEGERERAWLTPTADADGITVGRTRLTRGEAERSDKKE